MAPYAWGGGGPGSRVQGGPGRVWGARVDAHRKQQQGDRHKVQQGDRHRVHVWRTHREAHIGYRVLDYWITGRVV